MPRSATIAGTGLVGERVPYHPIRTTRLWVNGGGAMPIGPVSALSFQAPVSGRAGRLEPVGVIAEVPEAHVAGSARHARTVPVWW